MFSLHVDFGEACGFYNRSNGGVRQKLKTGSQCESVLLRCLTPARLIRMKQITSDEALSNQLLRLYHKSSSGLRRVTAIIKIIRKLLRNQHPQGCTFKKRELCMEHFQHLTTKTDGIAPSALLLWSGLVYFFFKQNLLAFRGEVLYNSTCR